MEDTNEVQIYKSKLNKELSIRGVDLKNLNEIIVLGVKKIPVLPERPVVKQGEVDLFLSATKKTLNELNIPETTISEVEVKTLTFTENIPPEVRGSVRETEQKLKIYNFLSLREISEKGREEGIPLVIFSHGGNIHPEVIPASGYLSTLYANNPDMMLIAMDHRGTQSHKIKIDYSLDDRTTDVLITFKYAKEKLIKDNEKKGVKWNGKTILIGDSMGGEVAAVAANVIEADGLVLTEPAAYPPDAHFLKMGRRSSEEPVFGGPDGVIRKKGNNNSHAFDSVRKYMADSKSKLLIIKMKNDKVVGNVPDKYIAAARGVNPKNVDLLEVGGGHGSTTSQEIIEINEFIRNIN